MQDLDSEGIIYRVAGRGTYPVAEQDRSVSYFDLERYSYRVRLRRRSP